MKSLSVIALLGLFVVSCSTTTEVSTQDLRAPFSNNKSEIDSCYTKVMKKQPDIGEGTVEMKFMINEDGKANKTIFMKKRSTLSNKLLNACIKKTVHNWDFPSGKNVDVVYTFSFAKQMSSLGGESQSPRKASPPAAKKEATASDEPKANTELDVIDTSPPEDEESSDEESTPME